ncbi:MAG: hypothetical protein JWO44_2600 [Bacteroidetes bacterium]|nr:hypothetical protein [Bacteroidota bacterium]
MKKLIPFIFASGLFGILLFSGCAKEEEPAPETPAGTDARAAFHGHWAIAENSSMNGAATYNVDITDSSNASFIQFAYLYGYHTKVRATVSGSSLTIPSQVVEGNSVSGSGTLTNANQINMSYLVWLGGSNYDTVSAVLTK